MFFARKKKKRQNDSSKLSILLFSEMTLGSASLPSKAYLNVRLVLTVHRRVKHGHLGFRTGQVRHCCVCVTSKLPRHLSRTHQLPLKPP